MIDPPGTGIEASTATKETLLDKYLPRFAGMTGFAARERRVV
ncbi:MAG: hypothetical protein QOG46_748 [Pseudonocardiales bacterium]|jgi:hypothetical protein|nr:hypothetical protein [Pseudonocardiales bacterium]